MLRQYFIVLAPVIGLAINVASQIISFRFFQHIGLLKSIFAAFIVGFFATAFLTLYNSLSDLTAILIVNLIIYSALGYCYFHFINLGETARRIRILREIYDSGSGLSMNEILERYNAKEITEKRLNRLINNKQITYKNGKYFIASPVMLAMARIMVFMKLVLLGKRSEFE
ncbi:hypothetical protein [Dissulfurispira sp.]|uniref:hypothetical protein n=1 Tax=Dissulfurispira sp. TaxID=2817609 RepID=UPI002FDA8052